MAEKKTVLTCEAGEFIGHHLTKQHKTEEYRVQGIYIKCPEFEETSAALMKTLKT